MKLRRTWAVTRKEFLHIVRDPRSLIMALALPLLMLLLFGYALTLDIDRIPTIVYDADRTPESRELISRFQGSRYFQILGGADDYRTVEAAIDRNECLLGVVIFRDYARQLLSGGEARVQLLLDGSDSNTASIGLGYARALLQTYDLELRTSTQNRRGGGSTASPIQPRLRIWYNPDLKSRNYIVPGLIAVILMIIAALLTSLTIAREWEMGTMEQLISTPLRATELVLGKMAAFFALGVIDMLVALVVGISIFRVPLRGSVLFLACTSGIFLVGALCWGILISALVRSQLLAYQLGALTSFLPAFLLSGFIFSIENMPAAIQAVTYIFPARYFVTILKGIFLRGVGARVLWGEAVLLLVYAVAVFLAATRKLKQKVA
ncbi:MAG: ABC transporter permease [Acidobacteriia bacterium]|nr:ABC transporter permease [Terriglobia bacterium]